jgi:multiple sugar transport system permease protein
MMGARQRHTILSVLATVAVALFCLLPLYWMVLTSFRASGTEFRLPVEYWPSNPTLENYRVVTGETFQIQRAIANSLIVSSVALAGTLAMGTLAAYAIARLRFRYKLHSLIAIQVAGMIPPIVVIAPTFVLVRALGLLGTLPGMALPNMAYGIPLTTWLVASYFAGLPLELEDAARVDGAGPLRIFWRIMLPLAAPGIFSAGVIAFLGSWGEFMLAFTVGLGLPQVQTVPVAILGFSQAFQLQWSWVSAGTILSLLPVILLVLVFQRWVIAGLISGAVK